MCLERKYKHMKNETRCPSYRSMKEPVDNIKIASRGAKILGAKILYTDRLHSGSMVK
jgi:hypothetical protein